MHRFGVWLLRALARGASDARLERWFGSRIVQRAIFTAMARGLDPQAAGEFEGAIVYELRGAGAASSWTIEVRDGRAATRRGGAGGASITIRMGVADFVRVAAGLLDPAVPLLQARASISGDLALAVRLPEMFGVRSV